MRCVSVLDVTRKRKARFTYEYTPTVNGNAVHGPTRSVDAFPKGLDSGAVRPERRLELAESTAGGRFARAFERRSGQRADRLAVRVGAAVGASLELVAIAVAVALSQRSPTSLPAEPSGRGCRGRQRVQLAVEASQVRRQRRAARWRLGGGARGRHGTRAIAPAAAAAHAPAHAHARSLRSAASRKARAPSARLRLRLAGEAQNLLCALRARGFLLAPSS